MLSWMKTTKELLEEVQELVEAAKLNKLGRHVERGVIALEEVCPLGYKGPRTFEELWAEDGIVHIKFTGMDSTFRWVREDKKEN